MLVSEFREASAARFPQKVVLVDSVLEIFKVPKLVEFSRDLPRSSHGKVSKRERG